MLPTRSRYTRNRFKVIATLLPCMPAVLIGNRSREARVSEPMTSCTLPSTSSLALKDEADRVQYEMQKHSRAFKRRARAIGQALPHLPSCLVGIVIDYSPDWATVRLIAKLNDGDALVSNRWEVCMRLSGTSRARQIQITIIDLSLYGIRVGDAHGLSVTNVAQALRSGHSTVCKMLMSALRKSSESRFGYNEEWVKAEVGRLATGLITWADLGPASAQVEN